MIELEDHVPSIDFCFITYSDNVVITIVSTPLPWAELSTHSNNNVIFVSPLGESSVMGIRRQRACKTWEAVAKMSGFLIDSPLLLSCCVIGFPL